VPANEITNTEPGEMFVHRNIANVVDLHDINLMSVMQYAVEYLKVKHIIVCGHYGCGGIKAAMSNDSFGKMDVWLKKIKDVHAKYASEVDSILNEEDRLKKMVELNVQAGVLKIQSSELIKDNPSIIVHGWVYDLHDGILHRIFGGETI
jgi:carbonic anhydrase